MTQTYKDILKDRIVGNGLAPLYAWGQSFQHGSVPKAEFLDFLLEQQRHFEEIVTNTLSGKGSIEEKGGIGIRQFRDLGEVLGESDWRNKPEDVERFVQAVLRLKGEGYERPEWITMLMSA